MKTLSILSTICGVAFMSAASAADITIYYSPTCPHCHNARNFISSTLIYEYPELKVTEVNVMDGANMPKFQETLKKCEYESGGVPVLVIGEKCFQGYGEMMNTELREAIEVDLDDAAKSTASENKKALEEDAEKFKSEHSDRTSAITEYVSETNAEESSSDESKKK
jgi:glutaredoxin